VSFNVLAIRSGLDTEDDTLHPILSDASQPELIALDALAGTNVAKAVATAVCVLQVGGRGLRTLVKLRDVKIDLYITDSRLALACEKYDKGGGWVGFGAGAVVAITPNAVSKMRATEWLRPRGEAGSAILSCLREPGSRRPSCRPPPCASRPGPARRDERAARKTIRCPGLLPA